MKDPCKNWKTHAHAFPCMSFGTCLWVLPLVCLCIGLACIGLADALVAQSYNLGQCCSEDVHLGTGSTWEGFSAVRSAAFSGCDASAPACLVGVGMRSTRAGWGIIDWVHKCCNCLQLQGVFGRSEDRMLDFLDQLHSELPPGRTLERPAAWIMYQLGFCG